MKQQTHMMKQQNLGWSEGEFAVQYVYLFWILDGWTPA